MDTVNFLGLECHPLENESLKLLMTRSVGPRILSFGFRDGENIFAELPETVIDHPDSETFHFYGGHRLWHAPEEPGRTYLPDDAPVDVTPFENGLTVTQKTEPQTSLQKTIEVRFPGDSPQVVITHHLTNHGLWPVTCALWAITQLKTGGTAIFPQIRQDTGVLPNRSLALWPYTDMLHPSVRWGSNFVLLDAELDSPFKIGFPNPRGWLAYWWDGILFVKRAVYETNAEYYDYGSSSESYCDHRFIELETLSPIRTIPPGETASHIETWELYREIDRPRHQSDAERIVVALGLE
jgi:hypothetical protein